MQYPEWKLVGYYNARKKNCRSAAADENEMNKRHRYRGDGTRSSYQGLISPMRSKCNCKM